MMYITLTHDNQSTLSSFSLFLSFVANSTVAEKALSGAQYALRCGLSPLL